MLVSNVGQGPGGVVVGGTSLDHAQGFTTGSSADGYTLTSVELGFRNATAVTAPTVTVHTGTPTGTTVATLTGPATVGTGLATFTAPDGTTLAVNTDYFVRIEGGGAIMQIVNAYSTGRGREPVDRLDDSRRGVLPLGAGHGRVRTWGFGEATQD